MHDVERIAAKLAQIGLASLAKLLGPAERRPSLVGKALASELGSDDEVLGIRVEGLGDEAIRDVRTVIPSRVDQIDAEGNDAEEHLAGAGRIVGLAPDIGSRKAHGAVAEADDFEVAEAQGVGGVGKATGFWFVMVFC